MTVRMRHTKGHTGNRRSHHALKNPPLSKCSNCGEMHLRHHVCLNCGTYRGKKLIDIAAKVEKKQAKAKKKAEAAK